MYFRKKSPASCVGLCHGLINRLTTWFRLKAFLAQTVSISREIDKFLRICSAVNCSIAEGNVHFGTSMVIEPCYRSICRFIFAKPSRINILIRI